MVEPAHPAAAARRRVGAVLAAALVAVTLVWQPAMAATVPAYHPSRLTHLGDARQVVVVSARKWSSSYAMLRTWEREAAGAWQRRLPETLH